MESLYGFSSTQVILSHARVPYNIYEVRWKMPWKMEKVGNKWQVCKQDTGAKVGKPHDTKAEAEAHMRALYANVKDMKEK